MRQWYKAKDKDGARWDMSSAKINGFVFFLLHHVIISKVVCFQIVISLKLFGWNPLFFFNDYVARDCRFYWCILKILPLTRNSSKRKFWKSSHTSFKALSWILLTLFSMFPLLEQKLHGFIKIWFPDQQSTSLLLLLQHHY